MKIAFATCDQIPDGTKDDALLKNELKDRGHHVETLSWSDSTIDWSVFDIVLIRSTWDYYKRHEAFVDWAKSLEQKTRLFNPLKTIEWNFSKEYLLELAGLGLSVVPTFISRDRQSCLEFAKKQLEASGQIIIKPTVSASSDLTHKIESLDQVQAPLEKIMQRCPALIQPYIKSIESEGEVSLIFFKTQGELAFSHAVLKQTKSGDFRVQAEFGGNVRAYEPSESLIDIAKQALNRLPVDALYARVDLVDYQSHPLIGEIELIEPELFFRFEEKACAPLAQVLESKFVN